MHILLCYQEVIISIRLIVLYIMEDKKQKQPNPRGEVVLADKSEAKSMLQMMNVVIADRDRKRDEK